MSFDIKIHSGTLAISEASLKGKKARKKFEEYTRDVNYFSFAELRPTDERPDILIEIAMGTLSVIEKKEKTHLIPCARKGNDFSKNELKKVETQLPNCKIK